MTSNDETSTDETSTDETATDETATDETAIRTLVDDRVAAMERGDAAALVAQYAEGAVVFSLAPPLVQPAGAARELWFRTTLGLRRQDGTRRVTHEHTSVPFAMDGSFRAVTDLRP